MPEVQIICGDCKANVNANVGQSFPDGRLRWYQSMKCEACCAATELDDIGIPPELIRSAILAESGHWKLIAENSSDKAAAIRVVREALELSLAQSKELISKFPQLYSGTEVECKWLQSLNQQKGIAASVEQVSLVDTPPA